MKFKYFKNQETDATPFGLIHNTNYFDNEIQGLIFIQDQLSLIYDFNKMSLNGIIEAFDQAAADIYNEGYKYTANNVFKYDNSLMSIYEVKSSEEDAIMFKDSNNGLVVYLVLEVNGLKVFFTSNYTFMEDKNGKQTIYYFD